MSFMNKLIQISENLHQFTGESALIIVAAKQEARVYRAGNGELELLEQFRIPTPHFSDNEALTGSRGKQENITQELIHTEYFDHFKKLFHKLALSFQPTNLYLFAPVHTANQLEELIKPVFGHPVLKTVTGIFTDESPFDLLARLG